ncbi:MULTISPECIES: CRISPR-associated endonuclease Cas2 [Oceanobacillus]|uniref:CRISPR-associated endoribonuclease Cas2 n=1 Tax=Oceanobacillus indicireducens TaxID=1004261 RepID=A0A917Y0Y5_9BACI|nr:MULTISPECIES: CRISPR-associated endonuclease Cas2 [Oceanobacillus]GGN60192.1 CRISPR-associated endoribonuclease Cas2 3 [Oceanobacillus indicireducens]
MLILVTYDVQTVSASGQKRLRKVAKKCEEYGVRVQNSVFECVVDSTQLRQLELSLESIIDPSVDSLRFYRLGNNYENKVKHIGAKPSLEVEKPLIF